MKIINKNTQKRNIASHVIKPNMCCGCGACYAVCPIENCIEMQFNSNGEPVPHVQFNICIECGLCTNTCPVLSRPKQIKMVYNTIVGHTLNKEQHMQSASGGLLTELLVDLLTSGELDAVAIAGAHDFVSGDPNLWFQMQWVTCESGVRCAAASKYTVLHHGDTLKTLKDLPYKNVAIVGVPCAIQAISKLREINPLFAKKIKYVFSLVCGHSVGSQFIHHLLQKVDANNGGVQGFSFRDKTNIKDTASFNFRFDFKNKESIYFNFATSDLGHLWTGLAYSMNKCLFCSEFDSIYSDASFSDAWLEKYRYGDSNKGDSIVVVRNEAINNTLEMIRNRRTIKFTAIPYDDFELAQKSQIVFKTRGYAARIKIAKIMGIPVLGDSMDDYLQRQVPPTYSELIEAFVVIGKVYVFKRIRWYWLNGMLYNKLFKIIEFILNPIILGRKIINIVSKYTKGRFTNE